MSPNGFDLAVTAGLVIPLGALLLARRPVAAAVYSALYVGVGLLAFAAALQAVRAS